MKYVSTDEGVGILKQTDSREELKYMVEMKGGSLKPFKTITEITQHEYESYAPRPVATTKKPARGKKS